MMPSEEQICERMPVWDALSEFFLDTELTAQDHQRIASALARSRYAEEELHDILRHEVYPACSLNFVCVAGAWGTFGEDWIRERIAPHYDHRPRFRLPSVRWPCIEEQWSAVKVIVAEQRSAQKSGP